MAKISEKQDTLTGNDLDKIAGLLDNRLAPMATKEFVENKILGVKNEISSLRGELKDEISGLKAYVNEGFEAVMQGIESITEKLAEKEKVDHLIGWAKKASKKIGVSFDI